MTLYSPALAYCTNIHPGESWEEIRHAVTTHLPRVRELMQWRGEYFPIGLRLSAQAAAELTRNAEARRQFAEWMEEHRFEVFCINGFPYGAFHGTAVKEKVFLPDWSSPERLEYTKQLFTLLHEWARPERDISVSTVPGSHKSFGISDKELISPVRELGRFLSRLREESGRDAHMGFEPEPFGQFDNCRESLAFLQKVFQDQPDEEALRQSIGITYDTCHFALQYECPTKTLELFRREGVRVSRIQASNALSLNPHDVGALDILASFDEPIYFHQVVVRDKDLNGLETLHVFKDLPDALTWAKQVNSPGEEWRCHFHIPIGSSPELPLKDTNAHLLEVIDYQKKNPTWTPHWEAETYTWSVLPDALKTDIDRQIAGELSWLKEQFSSPSL